MGPQRDTERSAILAWNRRRDAEAELRSVAKRWEDHSAVQGKIIDKLIRERDREKSRVEYALAAINESLIREAERRGAMAADLYVGVSLKLKGNNGRWFKARIGFPVEMTATDGTHNYPLRLDQEGDQWRIEHGEVLPAAKKK